MNYKEYYNNYSDVFTMNREEEINVEVINNFINLHRKRIPRYDRLEKLYKGVHEILMSEPKENGKPDNRLVVNLAKYITDTFNGFFIGIPIKTSIDDSDLNQMMQNYRNRNSIDDNESEISKMASIYGHAYEYLYQNENSLTDSTYINPKSAFVVYDDTIAQKPLFAVFYSASYDKDKRGVLRGELLTKNYIYKITGTYNEIKLTDEKPHYYGDVPLIEYIENEERMGLFEPVESLINALNKTLSEKANDVDYFSDAYLKVLGTEIEDRHITDIRNSRIINLWGEGSESSVVEFMQKPNADETQENLIDRLIEFIYQISMVSNIKDDTFNATSSGVALEFKLLPMMNLALMKERKFRASLLNKYKMIFNIPTNVPSTKKDKWQDIRFTFTRNIPHNILSEVQTAQGLASLTSKETALSVLSIIDNPITEIERINEEEKAKPLDYDFLTGLTNEE